MFLTRLANFGGVRTPSNRCLITGTTGTPFRWRHMPRYYFHLEGPMTARDKVGHECRDDQAAKNDGESLAPRVPTKQPDLVPEGSYVLVTNAGHERVAELKIASDIFDGSASEDSSPGL